MSDPGTNPDALTPRQKLLLIYQAALAAVNGRDRVSEYLRQHSVAGPVYAVAIGKAAGAMILGAGDVLGPVLQAGLLITRYGHVPAQLAGRDDLTILESGHPVPDAGSLRAGRTLVEFLRAAPAEAVFLFLISGGASALVEVLADGRTLEELQELNEWLLGSGQDIRTMNRFRNLFSAIKGGRLCRYLDGRRTQALYLSDVPDDDPAVIGSGLLSAADTEALPVTVPDTAPRRLHSLLQQLVDGRVDIFPTGNPGLASQSVRHAIVASSATAQRAAAEKGRELGYRVVTHAELLLDDIQIVAARILGELGPDQRALYVWGGEPAVVLPDSPGPGGRNQSLALAVALGLTAGQTCSFLSAGTDGSDGNSLAAGAIVDGLTCQCIRANRLDPVECLETARAYTALAACDCLVETGPTGSNVMDLMLALRD